MVGDEVEELGSYLVKWGWQCCASSEDPEIGRRKEVGGSKAETLQAPAEHPWEMRRGEARPWLQSRPTSTDENEGTWGSTLCALGKEGVGKVLGMLHRAARNCLNSWRKYMSYNMNNSRVLFVSFFIGLLSFQLPFYLKGSTFILCFQY